MHVSLLFFVHFIPTHIVKGCISDYQVQLKAQQLQRAAIKVVCLRYMDPIKFNDSGPRNGITVSCLRQHMQSWSRQQY